MSVPKFRKRVITLSRSATGDVTGVVGVGGFRYFKCSQLNVEASVSTTTCQITLTDANGNNFFADAADRSLTAATKVYNPFVMTADADGEFATMDAAGAALTAGETDIPSPILQSPITVNWNDTVVNSGTLRVELMVEV